jgi:Mn2+/Fe2+ NRAMP family transporter
VARGAKQAVEVALGIVTSVGGFLEIGSIVTAAQAGAEYRFGLTWAIALGGLCLIFLVEMSGRFAAVSKHTIPGAMRERFGFNFFLLPLLGLLAVMLLVLAAEIGGVCAALQLATGIGFAWWALPVAALLWLLLWRGTFGLIEKGTAFLGLVTLAFVVGAALLHPATRELAGGLVPRVHPPAPAHYWFLAVSILGASISPYLFFFYSSGALEDGWDQGYLTINRIVAAFGMSFGTFISIAVLTIAALVYAPQGIKVEHFQQLPLLLTSTMGAWGRWLFVAALGISCLGAALEVSLAVAYLVAQGFGWRWGESQRPRQGARFCAVYTLAIALGTVPLLAHLDPLKLTVASMALTATTLPLAIFPFIILMNDRRYVRDRGNGWLSNGVVVGVMALALVLSVVTIPLEIAGG